MEESSSSETRKRTRTESEAGPIGEAGTKRDEEFWFKDGNVVLQAGGVAFRVYQGSLSLNSEVFAGLFSVPQPTLTDTFDGCPVIELADHPDDLRHLLRAVFVDQTFYRHNAQLPFVVVASVVRLAHKYGMEHLRDDALERMKSCFSDDLHVWAKAEASEGSALMTYDYTDAIAAVNIARLTETQSMLPYALYTCCQLDTEVILNGVPQKNGTTERLTQEDILRCLNARSTLVHDNIIFAYLLFTPTLPLACADQVCHASLQCLAQANLTFEGELEDPTCLADWITWLAHNEQTRSYNNLCLNCQAYMQLKARELRSDIWLRLPHILNLDVRVRDPSAEDP
ncbi:uncharacterized protein B0H18DRAFT_879687 [Fomitopsis serialis]|uniref:uncharacterized protein n=1 Tax=Fomitopsis serialis TaxID=139415 RepID=UPI00200849D6|nr:uncharacterized protein B0H18DRAFT_879687 [Neoantrodia serialis]KAH9922090.1 hypothetical protein B0H18DRAFT_879687 [Neoantrodia serialis]